VALITKPSIEAAVAAADMVQIVSARTPLRRSGARWVGRCPFHDERTPSFSVNALEKLFYCFGCGKGGDLIAFVRESEGLEFAEAVEWLAERTGVALEYEETSPRAHAGRERRKRLYALLEQAAAFYARHLWESAAGEPVRAYLSGRGLGDEVCRRFRLGLSPGGATLAKKARAKGFSEEELRVAGLVNRRGNDYFAQRLMFPLADARGRVVGFQARKLREDDPLRAKYVNTPEGELFKKGALLYGLDLARTAMAKLGRAYVVEGNTDVLALQQAGVEPVVASMGTALTADQVKELARLAQTVYLCFDGDAAGEAATLRGMELAAEADLDVRVVTLPAGLDPADVAPTFDEFTTRAEPYAVYRVRIEIERAPDPHAAYTRAKEVLDRLPDSPERQDAWRLANDRLDMTIAVRSAVSSTRAAVTPRLVGAGDRLERDALAGCVAHPELVPVLGEISPDHFDDDLHRRLQAHLVAREPAEDDDVVALLAELDARAESEGIDEETAKQLLLRLRERKLRRELATAGMEETKELQAALARVREAVSGLA
jgi:DNA primase